MRVFLLIGLLLFSACGASGTRHNPNDPDGNLVEYQLIDADTMQAIQGAYVNAVWSFEGPAGKVRSSQCAQGALLRSDANGWVRMDGPKSSYVSSVDFMVPGYEAFSFLYKVPDAQHVSHMIRGEKRDAVQYPAWEQNLFNLGYSYHSYDTMPQLGYYKTYPIAGFADPFAAPRVPKAYFVKWRSFPTNSSLSTFGTVQGCGDTTDVGFKDNQTNLVRAKIQMEVLCDEKWDSAVGLQGYGSLTTALWLVTDPMDTASWQQFAATVPSYPPVVGAEASRSFTKDERLKFCTWIQPFSEKLQ
jgi:hypothetical protein